MSEANGRSVYMKSRKFYGVLFSFVLVAMLALAGTGGASGIGGVVKTACTKCHSSKRICLNVGAKNLDMWKATVKTMVRKGAQLPADKINAAASYLTNLKPGAGEICQ